MTRRIEIDAGAVVVLQSLPERDLDVKKNAIVIIAQDDWTPIDVAEMVIRIRGGGS